MQTQMPLVQLHTTAFVVGVTLLAAFPMPHPTACATPGPTPPAPHLAPPHRSS